MQRGQGNSKRSDGVVGAVQARIEHQGLDGDASGPKTMQHACMLDRVESCMTKVCEDAKGVLKGTGLGQVKALGEPRPGQVWVIHR